MAGIRASGTKPEMIIRRSLHAAGWRFRLGKSYRTCGKALPGKPDLVFPGRKSVIFVNGCFWHGHDCALFKWPARNEGTDRERFWQAKILGNISRDEKVRIQLHQQGWRTLDVWECTLRGKARQPLEGVIAACSGFLHGDAIAESIGADQTVTVEVSA